MRKLYVFLLLVFLSSCTRYAYYQSPMHTNASPYKTLPLHTDSSQSAIYASGVFSGGFANTRLRDNVTALLGSVYKVHHAGRFQFYYGVNGSWGSYRVDSITRYSDTMHTFSISAAVNDSVVNSKTGRRTFGSIGASGGINYVLPFNDGGEWRVLGAEVSWNNECGNYLDFRKELPDKSVNLTDRNRQFMAFTISTEVLGPSNDKSIMGYKIAYTGSLRRIPGYTRSGDPYLYRPGVLSQTVHLTVRRFTGFGTFNLGGHAVGIHLGANIRLGRMQR